MSYNVKQILVLRKDLSCRKGKMIAQGAHASIKFITDRLRQPDCKFSDVELEWMNGSFAKICVSVDSEQELLDLAAKAKELGIHCDLIIDSGATEFSGISTLTCGAFGPDYKEKLDQLTGHLKLL